MKLLYLQLFSFISNIIWVVCSLDGFNYELTNTFALGRRQIPNYKFEKFDSSYALPKDLPPEKLPPTDISVHDSLYQGIFHKGPAKKNFKKIYEEKFNYEPAKEGSHIFIQKVVGCEITQISLESQHGVPYILRGGVGYNYFVVAVKARPYDALTGTVKVYCQRAKAEQVSKYQKELSKTRKFLDNDDYNLREN